MNWIVILGMICEFLIGGGLTCYLYKEHKTAAVITALFTIAVLLTSYQTLW